jgi:uncharacterized C2H2 Zn-finger protein
MIVAARCTAAAWESNSCVMLVPGGGTLPDGRYEIDRDSPLAELKIGGRYVFEFDRNNTRTSDGVDVVKDYSCKKPGCGAFFKTLSELGTHSKTAHAAGEELAEPDAEIVSVKAPCRCRPCDKEFPSRADLMKHKREAHGLNFGIKKTAETVPVPA